MQKFYADAFFSSPPKILGLNLKPLTLGHAFVLLAIESPYITDRKEPEIGDLFAAVWICSHDWTESRDSLVADTFKTDCITWCNTQADLTEPDPDIKSFRNYLETYMQVAPRYETFIKNGEPVNPSRKSVRVPWPLAAAWVLMSRMSEDVAWNMPIVKAFAYLAADSMFDETLIVDDGESEETPDGNS